jgi:hypothetical protein
MVVLFKISWELVENARRTGSDEGGWPASGSEDQGEGGLVWEQQKEARKEKIKVVKNNKISRWNKISVTKSLLSQEEGV